MSDGKDALAGVLTLLGVLAFVGVVAYWNQAGDVTPGLTYESGDRPREENAVSCHGNAGAFCPPARVWWTVPAGGEVAARFMVDGVERSRLTGTMQLRAGGCPAVVDWAITAQGRTVAQDTVRAGGPGEQFLDAEPLPDDRAVTVTARRTDGESCAATLLWNSPGAAEA